MADIQPTQEQRATPWKILLVDDDKEDYLLTRDMLRESHGRKFEISWASSYTAGRQELQNGVFDAVLVDYDLGDRSGIELIREAAGEGYQAPLILYTGRGNYEVDEEALQAGATMYLTKSEVNPLLLERTIRYAVERKQSEEALRHARDEARRQEELLQERNEALRNSDLLMRDFLEGTHDNFIALDRDWRFIYANAHYGEVMGSDPAALIGKNYWELYPQYLGTEVERHYHRAMVERAPVHFQQWGKYTPSLYDVSVYPTHEGIAVFSINRTEEFLSQQDRKQAEQALRDSEERFNKAFEASPNPIIISRLLDGKIENVNSAFERLFGYSRDEAIGKTSIELGLYANPQDREDAVHRLLAEGAVRKIELDIRNRAGDLRNASLSVAVVNISGEQAMVNVIEDITAHKQAEATLRHYAEELERSNQALQDFAFIASHDLQEPLRKISMFGNLLQSRAASRLEGEESNYLERMLNATGRMQDMINGLLELSRVNTRAGEFASVDLSRVMENVISDLEARIQAVDGQVHVDPLPIIEADESQMHRLFLNLIGNAIKYHRPGITPVVHVSAVRSDGQVVIRVKDNGIGIAAEDTARIFQPFLRLHGRDEYEGTGLGLAISQKIVERHHGKIEVESKEGQGTMFVVKLPG